MSNDCVFLVWREEQLHAICRTQDEANRLAVKASGLSWAEFASNDHDFRVEERGIVDVPVELDPYEVALLRDGTVHRVEVESYAARWVNPGDEPRTVLIRASLMGKGSQPDHLKVQLWAPTVDRAIELAQQWRGRYIDQGRWPEGA